MRNTIFSRTLAGASLIILASCGSPETQPEASSTKDTTVVQTQPIASGVAPLDVLKQYNRAMKRGDSSAVNFATGKAATTKSYDYLRTSASGFSITYDEPVIAQDSATIQFKVIRENSASTHKARLIKVEGNWKVERIEG